MLTESDSLALANFGALRDGMIPVPGGKFAYRVIPSCTPWGSERIVTFDKKQVCLLKSTNSQTATNIAKHLPTSQ